MRIYLIKILERILYWLKRRETPVDLVDIVSIPSRFWHVEIASLPGLYGESEKILTENNLLFLRHLEGCQYENLERRLKGWGPMRTQQLRRVIIKLWKVNWAGLNFEDVWG